MKQLMKKTGTDQFQSDEGSTLQREYGKTPNGNDIGGRWVLRSPEGTMIDFDQYRYDIAERHGLKLES